jgi:hypothetical protein
VLDGGDKKLAQSKIDAERPLTAFAVTERKVIKLGGLVGERSRKEDRNALMQSQVALIESGL